jgi:hypothetical protein
MADVNNNYRRSPRSRRPSAGLRLTRRDAEAAALALLCRASRSYHYLALFPSVKACNERMRLLFDHDVVDRTFPSCSAFGGAIYHVGAAGVGIARALLAERGLELGDEEMALLRRRPSPSVLDHALRVADVYRALCLLGPPGSGEPVPSFLPEALVRFDYDVRAEGGKGEWRRRCFAPDAALLIPCGEGTDPKLIFVEVDMGTVSRREFSGKLEAFGHVTQSRLATRRFGAAASAFLVVTVSQARLEYLRALARSVYPDRVLLTTFDQIGDAGPGVICRRPDSEGTFLLNLYAERIGGKGCTA